MTWQVGANQAKDRRRQYELETRRRIRIAMSAYEHCWLNVSMKTLKQLNAALNAVERDMKAVME